MDRTTSKTNDCYVEFFTFDDAVKAVNRHQTAIENGRQPRLGKRGVDMTLSSQGKLMQQLFPAAHGVNWYTNPYTVTTDSAYGWENFKGFVSEEEMTMLYKHIETPTHSPFAMNCPERPYECMISTLKKFPWFMTELVTIKQRHYIYNAALKMIGFLKETIDRAANPARSNRDRDRAPNADRLTVQLFNRLIAAAMSCPGFTVNQKDNIAYLAYMDEGGMRSFNQPRMADSWRHQYALGVKPGAPLDVVEYYIALIREETNRTADKMSIVRKQKLKALQSQTSDYWGHFWCETNYPKGADFDNMSLADAGAIEWEALKKILRRAIEGGPIPNY
ncbi:hypothetical protein F5Y04DRAFT_293370 [Hypomontagnella monticulosa]|nr:hypothetical protein F5Y04DRAFT_293370 [Hypomontagnella monticulosa]